MLDALASGRPGLRIRVLAWDWALIYGLEREPLPLFQFGWRTHERVAFALDSSHPTGASHHQKIVVVDDRVAFSGGLDLCPGRWDTPEHRAGEPRRDGGPFHDVQMAVDGEAAGALGEIFRERWRRATGHETGLGDPSRDGNDPWPDSIEPDLRDAPVAIARTVPKWGDQEEVREVERLHLDAIAGARRFIYIENQYLTSSSIGEALAERLREPDGPEVVIVSPRRCSGWLEETTMGVLRARLARRLRQADGSGRLGIFYPVAPGDEDAGVNVHAKVMVVDDWLARVGSANLSNRSMGLDTECDLAVESEGDPGRARAIASLRNRLLAEHLGAGEREVAGAIEEHGSLLRAIRRLGKGDRTLRDLDTEVEAWRERLVPDQAVVDPERPIRLADLAVLFGGGASRRRGSGRVRVWAGALALLAIAALGAAWRWTSLGAALRPEMLLSGAGAEPTDPAAVGLVLIAYLAGGLVMIPVTLLIAQTGILFGAVWGSVLSMAGSLASAAVFYGAGRLLGRDLVSRLPSRWLDRLTKAIDRGGALAVAALRLVPVAPFTAVNLMAGAARVRFRDYMIGTAIGMAPGITLVSFFGDRLKHAFLHPDAVGVAVPALVLAVLLAGGWAARRWLSRRAA